ncbi:MAG TPA: DNA repair exonuclease [Candidatus Acidoferrum sp.]|nr:DNA repair exonuclease [Candidatus Acidoferrum sp.]
MLRLLHTADVHLGARHGDLGEQAAAQRERQFAAFSATVDLAIAEKVDLVLIAGDLFDTNTQPRRSVERVAAELKRLADATVRTVIIPGTHDVYDRSSIYRAHDLTAMAGHPAASGLVTVLTPETPELDIPALDAVVYARVFATKKGPASPLAGFRAGPTEKRTWRIGMIHGSLLIIGKTDHDDVVFNAEEVAASDLDYLALGHWHSFVQGKSGGTTYAYPGSPEAVAVDQDGAGNVLLVTLDGSGATRTVVVEKRQVGKTRFAKLDIDAAAIANQPALIDRLRSNADPNLVLDARLIGVKPDELDIDADEVENALTNGFLKLRFRDRSVAALSGDEKPSADTILGAFIRDTEARVTELEAAGKSDDAAELRDVLRLGRLLLGGHEVTL